jgi:hypothetical protein
MKKDTTDREIYSVVFNKPPVEGDIQVVIYTVGVHSRNAARIPEKIEIEGKKVIVSFTDGTRHHIPYTDAVEIFDRPVVQKKEEEKEKDKKQS